MLYCFFFLFPLLPFAPLPTQPYIKPKQQQQPLRNPYLSVILPPLITERYPSLARGLAHNQQSLVTGYEIHATLKMLASGQMPEYGDNDDTDGGAWRKGTLFDEEIDPTRTCEQAKIPEGYCRCK